MSFRICSVRPMFSCSLIFVRIWKRTKASLWTITQSKWTSTWKSCPPSASLSTAPPTQTTNPMERCSSMRRAVWARWMSSVCLPPFRCTRKWVRVRMCEKERKKRERARARARERERERERERDREREREKIGSDEVLEKETWNRVVITCGGAWGSRTLCTYINGKRCTTIKKPILNKRDGPFALKTEGVLLFASNDPDHVCGVKNTTEEHSDPLFSLFSRFFSLSSLSSPLLPSPHLSLSSLSSLSLSLSLSISLSFSLSLQTIKLFFRW